MNSADCNEVAAGNIEHLQVANHDGTCIKPAAGFGLDLLPRETNLGTRTILKPSTSVHVN